MDRSFICSLLKQPEISKLCRVSKPYYQLIRPILYRHPSIDTYASLILFSRTISRATYMGKVDRKWSDKESLDQTRTLDLTIDPTKSADGQPPPAVMISRTIHAIVRRCPQVAITLQFARCQCRLSPISSLETETFPGVVKLIIYVGSHDPESEFPNPRIASKCQPSAKFWRPFVNGMTFPDCVNLEIRHHWSTTPPSDASLDLRIQWPWQEFGSLYMSDKYTDLIGCTDGLKRFESINLECPPEIDTPLLMQLLGNPNTVASNLTSLELRYCKLFYDTYAKLLYHAPPNIKRLVLLCCDDDGAGYWGVNNLKPPHLCPLVRDFSKRLNHLEFGAAEICRELFFDDLEIQSLQRNGIDTHFGAEGGAMDSDKLDKHAIRETVQACRRQKRTNLRNERIKEAIAISDPSTSSQPTSTSLFGSSGPSDVQQTLTRVQRETETLLDEEDATRSRLIENSKTPWDRRLIAYHGLCNSNDTWEELQIAAEMEEKGTEWVLACKCDPNGGS